MLKAKRAESTTYRIILSCRALTSKFPQWWEDQLRNLYSHEMLASDVVLVLEDAWGGRNDLTLLFAVTTRLENDSIMRHGSLSKEMSLLSMFVDTSIQGRSVVPI